MAFWLRYSQILYIYFGIHFAGYPKPSFFCPVKRVVRAWSRAAAFRLQFAKSNLFGNTDLVWRSVACYILRSPGGLCQDFEWF